MREYTAPQVQPVYQRLRAWRAGQLLLDTRRAHLYFPDDRRPLWAVPAGDLRLPAPGALTHDGLVLLSGEDRDVRLWTYRHPDPEAAAIASHLAAAAEHPGVLVTVDGTPETQP
jgi:uncharacterized protein (DUF427 family)